MDLDREYYQRVHGFDPVADRVELGRPGHFKYEARFALKRDAMLDLQGVEVVARVEVTKKTVHNRIVFQRGDSEATVNCVHTAVCAIHAGRDWQEVLEDQERILDLSRSTENQPVHLSPEEHFASLKSYVAGIAEAGITSLLRASYHSARLHPMILPFGFNSALQKQIIRALKEITPETTRQLVQTHLLDLAAVLDPTWFASRVELLDEIYDLKGAFFTDPVAFALLLELVESVNLVLECASYPRSSPAILAQIDLDRYPEARAFLAQNPQTPTRVLEQLARDPSLEIRRAVAAHANLSGEALEQLRQSDDLRIQQLVAVHPATSLKVLRNLANHPDATVRLRVEHNRRATGDILAGIDRRRNNPHLTSAYYETSGITRRDADALAALEWEIQKRFVPFSRSKRIKPYFIKNEATGNVVWLSLRDLGLTRLPEAIGRLRDLDYLDLSGNQLDRLPAEVGRIRALKKINLAGNQFTEIPPCLFYLPILQSLCLDHNQIRILPGRIGRLRHLAVLSIQSNRVQAITRMLGNLESLHTLNLNNNLLRKLPPNLAQVKCLTSLHARKNHLTRVPEELGQVEALEFLDLGHNQLDALPASMALLGNLRKIFLNNNRFRGIPAVLTNLARLTVLDLSENAVRLVPGKLNLLARLTHLYLEGNQIQDWPGAGMLNGVPAGPVSLQELNLANNMLESIPGSVGAARSLRVLDLSHNRLRALPETLGNLHKLETLHLEGNQLHQLPASLSQLPALRVLNLCSNDLHELRVKTSLLEGCTVVGLEGNPLPESFVATYHRGHARAPIKLVVVGGGGAGNTTLLRRYVFGTFDGDTSITQGVEFFTKDIRHPGLTQCVHFYDFAGEERFRFIIPTFLIGAAGALVVLDLTRFSTLESVEQWVRIIRATAGDIPVFLVGNKSDLLDQRSISAQYARDLATRHGLDGYMETSAKNGENILQVFQELTRLAVQWKKAVSRRLDRAPYDAF